MDATRDPAIDATTRPEFTSRRHDMKAPGERTVTLRKAGQVPIETGLGMRMGAVGATGTLLDGSGASGVGVKLKSDAMWVRTESDATTGLKGATGDVSRLRLGLAADRTFETGTGGEHSPRARKSGFATTAAMPRRAPASRSALGCATRPARWSSKGRFAPCSPMKNRATRSGAHRAPSDSPQARRGAGSRSPWRDAGWVHSYSRLASRLTSASFGLTGVTTVHGRSS